MEWALLNEIPKWPDVEKTLEYIIEKELVDPESHTEIFDDFALVSQYIDQKKILEWKAEKVSPDKRWVEVFKHFKSKK